MINIYKASSALLFVVTDLLLIWYYIIIIRQRQSHTCCHRNRQDIKRSSLYGRTTCFIQLLSRSSRYNFIYLPTESSPRLLFIQWPIIIRIIINIVRYNLFIYLQIQTDNRTYHPDILILVPVHTILNQSI